MISPLTAKSAGASNGTSLRELAVLMGSSLLLALVPAGMLAIVLAITV
jgi:hypothetical protein